MAAKARFIRLKRLTTLYLNDMKDADDISKGPSEVHRREAFALPLNHPEPVKWLSEEVREVLGCQ